MSTLSGHPTLSKISLLQALFNPRSIALLGVSGNPAKNTMRSLRFLQRHGFRGNVYPVNPSYPEILGIKSYPDIRSLPEPVDHVFSMVGSDKITGLLDDCAHAGASVVTIYSDGFGEKGFEGLQRQKALIERAQSLGLRVLGPNSIGLANITDGCVISVNAAFSADNLIPGSTSLISQSGSMMGSVLSRAAARGFGFAKSISVGNEADISVGEILKFLVDDPETNTILLFLETVRKHEILADALRRAYSAGKPVIVYKLGRSEQGRALSQSHTGAMAGNDVAIDTFLREHGAIRVNMLDTLYEMIPLAARYCRTTPPVAKKPAVAVLTTTGGGAAAVVDAMNQLGLKAAIPPDGFIEQTKMNLQLELHKTPVMDVTLAASSAQYRQLLESLLQASWCDGVLSVVGSSAQFHPEYVVQPLIEIHRSADKPLAVFLTPHAPRSLALLSEAGIAAFQTPEGCADALANWMKRRDPMSSEFSDAKAPLRWPDMLPRDGVLSEYEGLHVLDALGIPHPPSTLLKEGSLAHDIDYPLVAKVCSRDIQHKTDSGGVITNIRDYSELVERIQEILHNVKAHRPDVRVDGILVQTQEERLLELILGFRRDPLVGPIIMLGAGGIMAEVNRDFSVRLAPTTVSEAYEMINEVRATRLISGFRNLPRGDLAAIVDCIVKFSKLALLDDPCIEEAEINPLFVMKDRVAAVDILFRVSKASA